MLSTLRTGLAAALLCLPAAGPALAEPLKVVTTFTILRDIAQDVAGDRAVVRSITRPGAEIHDYDPTPRDLVQAREADLVLRNGLGLERWFERFLEGLGDLPSATLSDGVAPMDIAGGPYAGRPNPHAWMSPANALIYVDKVERALAAADPANAEAYRRNAAAYRARFEALGAELARTLAQIPAERRVLVSCEGAFSYLARDYGMQERHLWTVNSEQEGTPQQVRGLIDDVRHLGVPVVFCESTVNDKAIRQVVAETGAGYGGTLYVDSLTDAAGPAPTYLAMLAHNVQVIRQGFDVTD